MAAIIDRLGASGAADRTRPPPRAALRGGPWFLSPPAVVGGLLIPAYVLMWVLTHLAGLSLSTAKGFDFFDAETFAIGLVGLLALLVGTLLPVSVLRIDTPRHRHLVPPDGILWLVGLLAITGYAYWFKDLALDPSRWIALLSSSGSISYEVRQNLERTAGLASLATLGLAYIALLAHRVWVLRMPATRGLVWLGVLITLLTLFRAFAWAERLALLELLVVLGTFWLVHAPWMETHAGRRVRALLPPVALVLGVLFFGAGEYFRSWTSFYSTREDDFWLFILQRLMNYYYQALNTGAGRLAVMEWPTFEFYHVLGWLYSFPILLGPLFRYVMQPRPDEFLERWGDPEFNNPCGLFAVFYDCGTGGGILVWLLVGVLTQSAWRAFRDPGNVLGVFYPTLYVALLEVFRYFYLGTSRAFPVVVMLVLAILVARRAAVAPATSGALR